jgi:hypothetical protein
MKRAVLLGVLMLSGCALSQGTVVEGTDSTLPQPFELEVRAVSTSRRVLYRLDAKAELEFGGGRNATFRETDPVGRMSDEDRLTLWRIIRQYKLLDAGGPLLAVADKTTYEVQIVAGGVKHKIKTADDKTPGVPELEQALYKIAGDMRYKRAFRPIEEKIQNSGGTVKKTYDR